MSKTSASTDPVMLEQRPEARAFKIEDMMLEVQRGRLRIPSFQRRLTWDRQDARKLIDSLYRGYPVGTLLLWETAAHADQWYWGALSLHAEARSDALWVVDGQQRLVSLARVLLTTEEVDDDFALCFDLDDKAFVFPGQIAQQQETDPSRWLPMNRLLDSERLFTWLYEKNPSRERRDRALQLGKRIREYDIPAYIVRDGSEDVLREIFGRLNTYGKQLKAAEVFDALNGARTGSRPTSLVDMAGVLAQSLDFGHIEQKILYRLLRVLHGQDAIGGKQDESQRLEPQQAHDLYAQTEVVMRKVIQFVRQDAGIAHYHLLPYKQPLVTLGKFFYHHAKPSARSVELLARWLWRGALNGAHRGDGVSNRTALEGIDITDENKSIQNMLEMAGGSLRPNISSVADRFIFRSAACKLQALALLELRPRDLLTGELLDIGAYLNYREEETDIPFVPVFSARRAENDLTVSAANRLAHPPRPGGLRLLLMQVTDSVILASHAVTPEAKTALMANDANTFLRLRSATLQTHFERVVARHARWDASDRPAIASLVVSDHDEENP